VRSDSDLRALLPSNTASRQRNKHRLNRSAVVSPKTTGRQRNSPRSTELRHPARPSNPVRSR